MRIRLVALFLTPALGLLAAPLVAEAQKPIRIGALTESWGPTPQMVGLRDGLRKLGYRENEDFVIGVRFTQGDISALPKAARELVKYGVDINVGDPVRLGLVESFARPGGNITGVTDLDLQLGPTFILLMLENRKRHLSWQQTKAFGSSSQTGARP